MKDFRFYLEENKNGISIEMPGFSKDEISVFIDKGFLNVAAEKKHRKTEKGKNFYREEAFQSSFRRSISLPEGMGKDDIEIKVEDGSVKIRKKKKVLKQ